MAVQTQIQVRRGTASSWTSTNPTLAAGEIGFESDTGKIKVGNGSSTWNSLTYIGAANAIQYVYNASAGQTTFSGTDANGATLAYTVGAEQVYVNGVLQVRGTDYTATNGTSVVLTTATIASDIVTIIAYGTFTVADTYTQAQANATFPLNTSAFFAGKNKIINGDFGIWQRGTSFSTSDTYTADRWYIGTNATFTASRQSFTPGTAPVSGYEGQYFARIDKSSGGTYVTYSQRIEDVRTFAGQTITVSFWAKVSSGTATNTMNFAQNFGSGGSATVDNVAGTSQTLTTSWQRFSFTTTLPSISGKTIGANSWLGIEVIRIVTSAAVIVDLWGVQVEAGSVATAFQTATGTIQGELAACQRYYQRFVATGSGAYMDFSVLTPRSTAQADAIITLKVPLRVAATSIDYSTLASTPSRSGSTTSINAAAIDTTGIDFIGVVVTSSGTPFTVGTPALLVANNSTSAYIGFSAEL